jgi:rfaE bifunctional protein nucleotidyltransferase chain/domain
MNTVYLTPTDQEYNIIENNGIDITNNNYIDYRNKVCIKPWGYEFLVYESKKIGMWFLKIVKDQGTSLHTHFKKDTFVIVVSGTAKITLINNEVISLGPMKSLYIPKNKFHALSSFSEEVYLLEMEIFDKDTTFSDKNDLLRIDDKYNRKRTGYQSSVSVIENNLEEYNYFYLDDKLKKYINDTLIQVKVVKDDIEMIDGYNILLDGELYSNGLYIKEGSMLNSIDNINSCNAKGCTILQIQNTYAYEYSKIIYSMEHLNTVISDLNTNNKKIILTSGCYDIIHVGHLHNLKKAKEMGDILIACLSCDSQINRLKGENRPINNYNDRINLFKTISYVDYIILYDEDDDNKETTLGTIMKIVNPYCWVKGSDYNIDKIMEKHPYLNKVVLIDNIKNVSTTNIINSILHNNNNKQFKD